MTERELPQQEFEAFRETFKKGLEIAVTGISTGEDGERAVNPSFFGMSEEEESSLSQELLKELRKDLFESIGISTMEEPMPFASYKIPYSESKGGLEVNVFGGKFTNPETQETSLVYLHEAKDGRGLRWVLCEDFEPPIILEVHALKQ